MHMEPKTMTPEEMTALKDQAMQVVEEVFSQEGAADMTKADLLKAVAEKVEALQDEPDMGGLGEEQDAGMPVPEDSDSDGE